MSNRQRKLKAHNAAYRRRRDARWPKTMLVDGRKKDGTLGMFYLTPNFPYSRPIETAAQHRKARKSRNPVFEKTGRTMEVAS